MGVAAKVENSAHFALTSVASFYTFPPMRGVVNIIIGIIFIIGGLSGRLSLIGTHSGPALAVVGGLLIAFGLYRMAASRG